MQIEKMIDMFLAEETAAYQVLQSEKDEPLPLYFSFIIGEFITRLREIISDFYDPLLTGNYEKLRAEIQEIANILPEPLSYGAYQQYDLDEKVAWDRYISLRTRVYQLLNDVLRQVKTSRGVPTEFVPLDNT